jgi:hypothetical protein
MKKTVFVFMIAVSMAMSMFGQAEETETSDLFDRKWSKESIEKLDKSVVWVPRFKVGAGLGGAFNGEFTNWKLDKAVLGGLRRYDTFQAGGGFYGFADLTFVELHAGLDFGYLDYAKPEGAEAADISFPANTIAFHGAAYLKYPVSFAKRFTVFPLLGAEYDLYFGAKREDDGRNTEFAIDGDATANAMNALSAFSFKFGLGGDVFFTEHLFLRSEIMYGIRLKNKMEKRALDQRSEADWALPHGGSLKFAIGWQF